MDAGGATGETDGADAAGDGRDRGVRADASAFAGASLTDLRGGGRGWTAVGVARDGAIHTDGATTVEAGDEVFVAAGDEALRAFDRTVDAG